MNGYQEIYQALGCFVFKGYDSFSVCEPSLAFFIFSHYGEREGDGNDYLGLVL